MLNTLAKSSYFADVACILIVQVFELTFFSDASKIFIKLRKKSVAFEFITLDISIEGIK